VLCGSTYLNKRLRSALEKKLQGTENLEDIEAKIDLAVNMFDENCKPTFNGSGRSQPFQIPGLPDSPEKGFRNGCVWFSASASTESSSGPFANSMQERAV
jgi:hypothetical protein